MRYRTIRSEHKPFLADKMCLFSRTPPPQKKMMRLLYAFPWIPSESCKCRNAITYFLTLEMYTVTFLKITMSLPPPRWYRFPKFGVLAHGLLGLVYEATPPYLLSVRPLIVHPSQFRTLFHAKCRPLLSGHLVGKPGTKVLR